MLAGFGEVGPSDHQRKLVEHRGERQSGAYIHPELVVPSAQVLDEGMSSEHDAGGSVLFQAPRRSKSCL